MDGNAEKPLGGNKAVRPAPAAADATDRRLAPRPVMETPALPGNSPAAARLHDGEEPVASVEESCGGDGEARDENQHDDDDDEQVERFYALLANIRAMRGQLPPRTAAGDDDDDSTRKKRLRRSAEPPWRPAFRMEDFEEPAPPRPKSSSSSCKRKQADSAGHDGDGGARPRPAVAVAVAVVASPSPVPHAAVRPFQQSDSGSSSRD